MSDLFQGFASLTKTVQQTLNSYEVRKLGDKVQGYVMNFTETEQKVREATNEDPWGPTGPEMQEIASLTFQYDQFSEVMGMLWKRMLQDNKVAWRRVYKSLILLNHLLKNGSERVISTTRDHAFELRVLESYKCVDERGKDEGVNVRHRIKLIMELLNDEDLLRAERRKSKSEGREKYQGYSKDDMLCRGGGSSASSKIDSFERWNEKKPSREGNMDFERKEAEKTGRTEIGRREVTAFDFDESRSHANGSPELGIRERTPEPVEENEDDDFGDFTSARATGAAPQTAVPAVKMPPPLTPPAMLKKMAPQNAPATQISVGEVDLLGLGADFGGGAAKQANPAQSAQAMGGNNLLDDFFHGTASPAVVATPVPPTVQAHSNAPTAGSNLFDLFDSPPTANPPGGQQHFDPLDGLHPMQTNGNGTAAAHSPQQQQQQRGANKIGSTWEDLKGKVNIDFENLSLKNSPTKVTPSLNELKGGTGTPSGQSSLW